MLLEAIKMPWSTLQTIIIWSNKQQSNLRPKIEIYLANIFRGNKTINLLLKKRDRIKYKMNVFFYIFKLRRLTFFLFTERFWWKPWSLNILRKFNIDLLLTVDCWWNFHYCLRIIYEIKGFWWKSIGWCWETIKTIACLLTSFFFMYFSSFNLFKLETF